MKSRPNPFLASALSVALALPALADTTIPQGLNNIDTTGNPALGVITRSTGATAWFNAAGTATATGTPLVNGILGPWATIGTGTNTRYATLDGSNNVLAYTGAIAAPNFGWASGNPATNNYDVAATGTEIGVSRTANTLRYTGGQSTQQVGNSNATLLTLNGLLNVGSGTLTLSRGSNASSGLRIGSTQELVINAANAGISISAPIYNNAAGASALTITGPGGVTLSGTNTYTGGTTIASGSLTITGGTLGSGGLHVATGATFNINASQTISQTVTGSGAISTTKSTTLSGDFSGFSGTYTHSATANNDSTAFTSTAAASKDAAYSITTAQTNDQGILLGVTSGNNIFEMGSLSGVAGSMVRNGVAVVGTNTLRIGNLNTDTEFAGSIVKGVGGGTLALEKVGSGTLTLSGTNTYTGATTVTGGTLAIDGSTHANSAVTVAAGTASAAPLAKLAGKGTVGGNVSLTAESASGFKNGGVLAPTAAASGTKLTVSGTTTFNTGSIFEWNMRATTPTNDPGNGTTNSGTYGQLAGTGAITGSDAVFKIVLGAGNAFTDAFWNTDKTWNNLFTGDGATTALTSIFSSIGGAGITYADSKGTVDGQGYFTLSSTSTLNWTAVPEPTSALAGLLLTAGLLRRRRA